MCDKCWLGRKLLIKQVWSSFWHPQYSLTVIVFKLAGNQLVGYKCSYENYTNNGRNFSLVLSEKVNGLTQIDFRLISPFSSSDGWSHNKLRHITV